MKITAKYTLDIGDNEMGPRMKKNRKAFCDACGAELVHGTINLKIGRRLPIKEDFRINGIDIGEPEQDILFERCLLNGTEAFRVRPLRARDGTGGHGDHIIEIVTPHRFDDLNEEDFYTITFFEKIY